MTKTQGIASFVLRFTRELWQDAQGEPHLQWRGHIRHVQGDEENRFTDFSEALVFIQRYLMELTLEAFPIGEGANPEIVFRENFKIWEQLASAYTNIMVEAVNQTVKQSRAVNQQMSEAAEQAMKMWQRSVRPGETPSLDQQQIIEALHNLQKQVQELTDKVDRLDKAIQQEKSLKQ